jgi:hypothetical protein
MLAGAMKFWAAPLARHKTLPKAATGLAIFLFQAPVEENGTGNWEDNQKI